MSQMSKTREFTQLPDETLPNWYCIGISTVLVLPSTNTNITTIYFYLLLYLLRTYNSMKLSQQFKGCKELSTM